MGKKVKNEELKVITVEFKISMYCNACERTIAKTISKCKVALLGVEKFTTDMNKHKVVITGRIDPNKLLKKLKKKTGKRVEILANNENDDGPGEVNPVEDPVVMLPFVSDFYMENQVLIMFSDENPNACSIM